MLRGRGPHQPSDIIVLLLLWELVIVAKGYSLYTLMSDLLVWTYMSKTLSASSQVIRETVFSLEPGTENHDNMNSFRIKEIQGYM